MLISPAYAQAAGAAPQGGDLLTTMLPMVAIFVVLLFKPSGLFGTAKVERV